MKKWIERSKGFEEEKRLKVGVIDLDDCVTKKSSRAETKIYLMLKN